MNTAGRLSPAVALAICAAFAFLSPTVELLCPTPGPHATDWSRLISWVASAAGYAGALFVWGNHAKKRNLGALIDQRNRISLSRFQMVLWTLLVLPTLTTSLLSNVIRANGTIVPLKVDWTLVALMGLSVTSAMAAPITLQRKAAQNADPKEASAARRLSADQAGSAKQAFKATGVLLTKNSSTQASFWDLVHGEETGTAGIVDLPRVQFLAITLLVWTIYLASVWRTLAVSDGSGQITALPVFSSTLMTLILLSHSGYLTSKVTPNSKTVALQAGNTPANPARRSKPIVNNTRPLP